MEILKNPEALKLLLAIPSFFAAIAGIYQLSVMRSRNKLKSDLELLKYYKEIDGSSPCYQNMKLRVDGKIQRLYPAPGKLRTDLDRSDLFWGCLLFIAGWLIWTFAPEDKDSPWQYFLYGIAIGCFFAGCYGVYKGFERKISYKRRKRANQKA